MTDFIIVVVLLVIIGAAVGYIRKAKKSGAKCIGCPAGGNCSQSHKESSTCSCGCRIESDSKEDCCCHTDTKK